MSSLTFEQIKEAALGLKPEDREELACQLSRSLGGEELELSDEWEQEISRRISELDSGKVVGVPYEEVMARLRRKFDPQ